MRAYFWLFVFVGVSFGFKNHFIPFKYLFLESFNLPFEEEDLLLKICCAVGWASLLNPITKALHKYGFTEEMETVEENEDPVSDFAFHLLLLRAFL